MAREVKQWITVEGQHIPIFEGQSKDSVVKSYIAKNKKAAASKPRSTSNAEKKPEEPKYKTQISEEEFQETIKKHFAKPEPQNSAIRESEDRKAKQIAKNKEQADIASGKKSSSQTRDEKLVNDLVNDITKDVNANSDPEDLISNGDVQSIVEAYAIMHKDVNENKILKAVRDGVEQKISNKPKTTGDSWTAWKKDDDVVYTPDKDFDTVGTPKPISGKVIAVEDDHALISANGMKLWVDKDNIKNFKKQASTPIKSLNNKDDIIDALATKYKLPANSKTIPVAKIRADLQEILKQSGKDWSDDDYYFMLGSIVRRV